MQKIAFRNKFRIITPTGDILRLNSIRNKLGVSQFVEGFAKQEEAISALSLYCMATGLNECDFKIESYSESFALTVPVIDDDQVNVAIARKKLFSGKGIKFNTHIPPKQENKYNPAKFYTREIWLEQSTQRNKGLSLVAGKGDKRKFRNTGVEDHATFDKMNKLKDNTTIHSSFIDYLIPTLKKMKLPNRKALKDYLRPRGFTNKQINLIQNEILK